MNVPFYEVSTQKFSNNNSIHLGSIGMFDSVLPSLINLNKLFAEKPGPDLAKKKPTV